MATWSGIDALIEITETSESNTVDRGSTLLQSGPLCGKWLKTKISQ